MQDNNLIAADLASSATGILECLRMLADEAAELQLGNTLQALQQAIATCELERGRGNVTESLASMLSNRIAVH